MDHGAERCLQIVALVIFVLFAACMSLCSGCDTGDGVEGEQRCSSPCDCPLPRPRPAIHPDGSTEPSDSDGGTMHISFHSDGDEIRCSWPPK